MKARTMHHSAAVLALFAMTLGGCANTPPAIPPTPLEDIEQPTVEVSKQWKRSVGRGGDYAGAAFEPAIADGVVYVAAANGRVSALTLQEGGAVWGVKLEQALRSGVAVDTQSVYVASRAGEIIALNRENGTERWRTALNREILEPPVVAGGRVLARAANGDMLSLDVLTGEQLWRYSSQVPDLSVRGSAAAQWVAGGYIVPLDDGRLVALDERSGRVVWETVISEPRGNTPVERIVDVDTRPVVLDNTVVVGSRLGDLVAVQGQSGKTIWRRKLSAISSLVAAGDRVLVVEQNGEVSAASAIDGSSQWRQEGLRGRRLTTPVMLGKHMVVGDLKGYLHWIDAYTGDIIARTRMSRAAIFAAPLVSKKSLVILDKKGRLARYTAAAE